MLSVPPELPVGSRKWEAKVLLFVSETHATQSNVLMAVNALIPLWPNSTIRTKARQTQAKASQTQAKATQTQAKATQTQVEATQTQAKATQTQAKATQTNARVKARAKAKVRERANARARTRVRARARAKVRARLTQAGVGVTAQTTPVVKRRVMLYACPGATEQTSARKDWCAMNMTTGLFVGSRKVVMNSNALRAKSAKRWCAKTVVLVEARGHIPRQEPELGQEQELGQEPELGQAQEPGQAQELGQAQEPGQEQELGQRHNVHT